MCKPILESSTSTRVHGKWEKEGREGGVGWGWGWGGSNEWRDTEGAFLFLSYIHPIHTIHHTLPSRPIVQRVPRNRPHRSHTGLLRPWCVLR
jgi:hypothetical protein